MSDKDQPRQPSHRAYAVIRREGQEDYWLNLGLVFPHKDNGGFNIMLQALPIDGKIVCREIGEEATQETSVPERSGKAPSNRNVRSRR